MGSHFHDLVDYNGVMGLNFNGVTTMGSHIFGFWGKKVLQVTVSKHTKMIVLLVKSKVFFIQFKKIAQFTLG